MAEHEPASVPESTVRMPARHGAPWENEELRQLIRGIEQGLSLSQLAKQHQRTPASIGKTAIRLIPPALRPDRHARSVDVLSLYLRGNEDVDRESLVSSVRPAPAPRRSLRPEARSRPARQQLPPVATAPGKADDARADATGEERAAEAWTWAESVSSTDASDVAMLVSVAVASLPTKRTGAKRGIQAKARDRDVLMMRLGTDGQPMTLAEIGMQWNVTPERVRQIQKRALRKLAASARREETPGFMLKKRLAPASAFPRALATWLLDVARSGFEIPPRLAANLVLRTAGFSTARADEILRLLPAVERARKENRRKPDKTRTALERAESIVTKWLLHSEWPATARPPLPAAGMSAQRAVNDSGISGRFCSQKLGREVQYESGLELEALKLLEHSERVAYYQEQPVSIPYVFNGRELTYYPDLFVALVDGRGLLVEVKPTEHMALSINRAKAEAGREWAHAQGWGWLVANDRHTFGEIMGHAIPAAGWRLLDDALKAHGVLTWREILDLRTRHDLTRLDFTAYVIQSDSDLDRGYRVTGRNADALSPRHG